MPGVLDYVAANRETLVEEYYALAVLVRSQQVVAAFKSMPEACAEGARRFGDGDFSVHNMLDYRSEEDKKWDDTLDNMTEEEGAQLERIFIAKDTGVYTPLDISSSHLT